MSTSSCALAGVLCWLVMARTSTALDPCGDIWLNASQKTEAMPRTAWRACYESRVDTLIGGYTMAGTNVFYNGSSEEFEISQGCVCDCTATADGVICGGTDGLGAYSLIAYVPEFQLAIAEMGM